MPDVSHDELEAQRQETLKQIRERMRGVDQFAEDAFGPGTLGCHEALHATSIALDMVERHVMEHPSIAFSKDWYVRAARAHHELFQLYQLIGGMHVVGDGPKRS